MRGHAIVAKGDAVRSGRVIVGLVAAVLGAAGLLAVPGLAASSPVARLQPRAAPARGIAGSFTPAAADPRLAAVFARGGLSTADFRFTPADSRRDGRAVMVAVRMRSSRTEAPRQVASTTPTPGLAPIAYNLGVAVGWKRFAVAGDLAHLDLGPQPGSRDAADLSVSYRAKRFTGRVKAATDRPMGEVAHLVDQPQSYSVDVGGAYQLTRRLDVTAGVRYRSDRERLTHLDDDRRDSQSAYVGTLFRF